MSAMHTPGPWRLHDMERATIVAGRPGREVANCLNGFGDQDANARLVAAAPDLAKALQRWQKYAIDNGWTDKDFHDADGTGWISATNAALAKAGVK